MYRKTRIMIELSAVKTQVTQMHKINGLTYVKLEGLTVWLMKKGSKLVMTWYSSKAEAVRHYTTRKILAFIERHALRDGEQWQLVEYEVPDIPAYWEGNVLHLPRNA